MQGHRGPKPPVQRRPQIAWIPAVPTSARPAEGYDDEADLCRGRSLSLQENVEEVRPKLTRSSFSCTRRHILLLLHPAHAAPLPPYSIPPASRRRRPPPSRRDTGAHLPPPGRPRPCPAAATPPPTSIPPHAARCDAATPSPTHDAPVTRSLRAQRATAPLALACHSCSCASTSSFSLAATSIASSPNPPPPLHPVRHPLPPAASLAPRSLPHADRHSNATHPARSLQCRPICPLSPIL
eukprot:XP_008650165.1 leucine-rich repeat extensin-like protein 3 [Zea mays]